MVKKTIGFVVAIVVLVGVGLLVHDHWKDQQNKNERETVAAQIAANQAQAREQATAQAERAKIVTQYNELRVECERMGALYDKLPAYLQKTAQPPKCGGVLL